MDNLIVRFRSEDGFNLSRAEPLDLPRISGRIIGETPSDFDTGWVADRNNIALFEVAHNIHNTNGKQALAGTFDGPARTRVDDISTSRSDRHTDPSLARCQTSTLGQKQRSDRFGRENRAENRWPFPANDPNGLARERA